LTEAEGCAVQSAPGCSDRAVDAEHIAIPSWKDPEPCDHDAGY